MIHGARGRGRGNYNIGRNSEAPVPLMTEHIRSLDLELELLKRKRDMIEQQQHLLNRQINYDNQRQYNPPMFESNNRDNSNRNFSFMYDDYPNSDYIPLNSGSRKRPSESTWRDNPQPKRFSGPKRGNAKKSVGSWMRSGANSASTSSGQTRYFEPSSMAVKSKPTSSQKPRITSTPPFKPKPKAAERKIPKVNESMILRPNRTPSLQLNGRLELGLGHLLKDIKNKYGSIQPYSLAFVNQTAMKAMKILIRERIREVMMGKQVGALQDIMTVYRQRYPLESDVDIVNEGLAHQVLSDVKHITKSIAAENPKQHFKENISLMVELKLHQMFLKLSEIYSKDAPIGDTTVELTPVQKLDDTDFSEDVTTESESNQTKNKETVSDEHEGEIPEEQENISKDQEDADTKKQDDAAEEQEDVIPMDQEGVSKEKEDTVLKNEEIVSQNKKENVHKTKEKAATMEIDENVTANIEETPTVQNVVLDRLIEQKLPEILKKHIKFIKSLLNFDQMYEALNKKAFWCNFEKQRSLERKEPKEPKEPKEAPPKYFVKLYGKKGLPKKNAMQEFLGQFNPKCVKKLKSMHNLLFVGFDDKEDFDKILANDGETVGKFPLQITVSENKKAKAQKKDADENKNDDVIIVENESADSINISSDDKILSADIDNQITDLLTSINQNEQSPNVSIVIEDDDNSQKDEDTMQIDEEKIQDADKTHIDEDAVEDSVKKDIKTDLDNIDSKTDKTDEAVDNKVVQQNGNSDKNINTEAELKQESVKAEPKTPTKNLELIDESEENLDGDGAKKGVEAVKNEASGKATPTRASSRIAAATPSAIRTRRASRLAQNN
ncbi:hypothetical protein K1T71_013863 [Dendrolimus kikuchii]|uniref:Uncharacterized protein n=1 Tax=Dendrolimus kikuchii TaxID=765133 RepID=A0ACC1CFY7_9NEOP|nr:hypothetical protein K1T71_013863 [Dendrolimus kikuchii]